MTLFTSRFSFIRTLVVCVALVVAGMLVVPQDAHAAPAKRYKSSYRNSDVFMERYCLYVAGDLAGLQALAKAILDLISRLEAINLDLLNFKASITPPSLACLNNLAISGNIKGPDFSALSQCLNGISVKVDLPNLNDLTSCLQGLIPRISVSLPSFDPSQCLPNISIDLPNLQDLVNQIAAIIDAVKDVLAALKNLMPKIQAGINPALIAHLKALANLCLKSGLRPRRS